MRQKKLKLMKKLLECPHIKLKFNTNAYYKANFISMYNYMEVGGVLNESQWRKIIDKNKDCFPCEICQEIMINK